MLALAITAYQCSVCLTPHVEQASAGKCCACSCGQPTRRISRAVGGVANDGLCEEHYKVDTLETLRARVKEAQKHLADREKAFAKAADKKTGAA